MTFRTHRFISMTVLTVCLALPVAAQCVDDGLHASVISEARWQTLDCTDARTLPALEQAAPLALLDGQPARKSPYLAGALSLLLPGAGEVYAQSYILAGAFLAAEATGWYFNIDENRRGDDATAEFEMFADQHWNVVKYAEWLNKYAKNFPGGENTQQIPISSDPTLPLWQRVDWQAMNDVEAAIAQFSHRLPAHGDQQYFELIGKYLQYSYGWDDKLEQGDGWSDYRDISARFRHYSGMRGTANDHYNTAETVASLIILNHVLSAINAAWAASRFNNAIGLQARADLRQLPGGRVEIVPGAMARIRF